MHAKRYELGTGDVRTWTNEDFIAFHGVRNYEAEKDLQKGRPQGQQVTVDE